MKAEELGDLQVSAEAGIGSHSQVLLRFGSYVFRPWVEKWSVDCCLGTDWLSSMTQIRDCAVD